MKVHLYLIKCILLNTTGCIFFEYLTAKYLIEKSTRSDEELFLVLGWIFWLGFVVILMPLFSVFINKPKAREWFTKEYIISTFILLGLHVYSLSYIGAILMDVL